MKSVSSSLAILVVTLAAACTGTTTPGSSQGVTPTTAGQATPASVPTQTAMPTQATVPTEAAVPTPPVVPPEGTGSVNVTLIGGEDAGTYTTDGETNCSLGLIGPGAWGVQFSLLDGVSVAELSSLQIVAAAPGKENDTHATFPGTKFLMTASIGPFLDPLRRNYDVKVTTDASQSSGTGSATVNDTGTSAVIHAVGTTADGVSIDATVNCPTVIRF